MVRTLVVRGLIAGLIAGFVAGGFAFAFGEPRIDDAIAIEEAAASAHASAHAHEHGEEAEVSRADQRGGLLLATTLSGIAMGALFGLAFALVRGRAGPRDPWRLALWLGGLVLLAVVVVPFIKYPANPPAVGDPETITRRTLLYVALIGCSIAAVVAALRAARAVRPDAPAWARPLAAGATFVAAVAIAMALLPGVDEVAETFPASLLWEFRLASLGTQVVLWLGLATLFGIATERAEAATR